MSSFSYSPLKSGPSPQEKQALPAQLVPKRSREPKTFPLSLHQQRLWFLDQVAPGSPVYNEDYALRLKTSLNVPAIERTLNQIGRRHEALRTPFNVNITRGADAILARHCAEAGAKQVYAIEMLDEACQCARDLLASLGPADRVIPIRGNAPEIQLDGNEYYAPGGLSQSLGLLGRHLIGRRGRVTEGWLASI